MAYRAGISCLSLWERWPSKSEDGEGKTGCNALSVTCGDSSPKGGAKGAVSGDEKWSVSVTDTLHSLYAHPGVAFSALPYFFRNASMASAPFLPAPMARITVAAPVAASPPAKMPGQEVQPFSSAATQPFRVFSRPGVPA